MEQNKSGGQQSTDNNRQPQNNENPGKQVDGPDRNIVNEQDQENPVNQQDDYEGRKKGYQEGNKNDNTNQGNSNEDMNTDDDELPGRHDDSEKTIKETPKMNS